MDKVEDTAGQVDRSVVGLSEPENVFLFRPSFHDGTKVNIPCHHDNDFNLGNQIPWSDLPKTISLAKLTASEIEILLRELPPSLSRNGSTAVLG